MEKILIIDDSLMQAEYLQSILKDDYETKICHTAADGLDLAGSGSYSLILLDVILPDMDGFKLLKIFKEMPLTKHVPVILITGLSDIQHEEKGLLLGAVDYITKPFSPIIIKARVGNHIRMHHYRMQFMQQAMIGELTGIPNRRCYEEERHAKWRMATRLKLPFSICMFDIDHFKLYNDTYGHPAGDKVISTLAKTVSFHLRRSTDFFARYGGEEFIALLIGNNAASCFEFLKKIRQSVEELHIPHNSPVSQWVTVSAGGVTLVPKNEDIYDDYLKLADSMLYEAKRLGRNRVLWCDEKKEWLQEKAGE